MADSARQMTLAGGAAALVLAAILLALNFTEENFLAGIGPIAAGLVALLGLYLVAGAAPWTTGDPAWARWMRRLWEIPFLALLGAFMLWVRLLPYKALVTAERAYYIGTDPFYHYREVLGIVRAFPRVPRWDPWTFYPNGTGTGQFGSLFDWGAAAYIVLTRGRDASEAYVHQVLGAYPAVLGALLIVPFYFLAKKLLGTPGAVVASITLALLPGEFLIRSIAGYSDHHVAEALTCVVGILGVYVAATKAQAMRDRIVSWPGAASLRGPLPWAILGGFALALNFYVWQPAILFLAILTLWLSIVILLEDGKGGDARGYAFGGAVAFLVTGLLMIPVVETYNLSEFNTYGILHPIASFVAAIWLVGIHFAARWTKQRDLSPWVVPGVVGAAGVLVALVVVFALSELYGSILWGLSWVTGFGVRRTMLTIAEARQAQFFCQGDTSQYSCLASDFGATAPLSILLVLALLVWAAWKRRPSDILLLLWSVVVFRATTTQIRFSYYLALNVALLVGWLAARIAEGTGLEAALAGRPRDAPAVTKGAKGRKTKRAEASAREAHWWQAAAVAAALLIVLPGNVVPTTGARPGWMMADIRHKDGDLVLWMEGLDWMRANTPDAGVDLGLIVPKPPEGQLYDYPPSSYGVLTWWDYGHWIETIALRPPVANPFQQAAPFASTWFTERDPAQAEKLLDDWVRGKGPIRYIVIDDAIATGKWGAITVWANSMNASRPALVNRETGYLDPAWLARETYSSPEGPFEGTTISAVYKDNMMGRLYDGDGRGLSHYRLVWEAPAYGIVGSMSSADGNLRCFHDIIPSQSCYVEVRNEDFDALAGQPPGSAFRLGDGSYAYDTFVASRLKIFERVEGARIVGAAPPGSQVRVGALIAPQPDGVDQSRGAFPFDVAGTAGPDGRFEIVFPYSNVEPLGPANGGTTLAAHVLGRIQVLTQSGTVEVDVPERAVLEGLTVNAQP